MKDQENRGKLFFWKKGPVAKTILYSYLIVLLLPLILTVLMTTTAVLQLQKENARHVESTSTELSRVFSAYVEEIQSNNTRLLISENTRRLSLVNPDSFSTSDILLLRDLQKQLPKATVTSEYIQAIYLCFLRSGTMIDPRSVYYNYNAAYMLKDRLGMSLPAWKSFLASVPREIVTLITGDLDNKPHILIANRLSSHGGISDVIAVTEFRSETAVRLMDEFSENGGLYHTLVGENGAMLSASSVSPEGSVMQEMLLPIGNSSTRIDFRLKTETPKDRFLRQTLSLFFGYLVCALLFAVFGWLLIRYFSRRQYSPIEKLNASLLSSLSRSGAEAVHAANRNEYEMMSEAISVILQNHASSHLENERLQERIRTQLLQGILFGNVRKEEIILRHAENNGIRFVGKRFLVVLYAVEDVRREDQSPLLMQNAEALSRLDEIVRTAIDRLADNGSTRYAVEVEENVACIVSLPDSLPGEQIWKDTLTNIMQVRDFFRDTFGVILTAAVSSLHSGVVSITTCFRECREAADYMELIGTDISVCRYDQIPAAASDTLSFPELLEKEKKLCRNLSTGDYLSAESTWPEVVDALSLRKCSPEEGRIRLLGVVNLMSSSLGDLPSGAEDSVRHAFDIHSLRTVPDLDSMLDRIRSALSSLASGVSGEKDLSSGTKDLQFVDYVNANITDPSLSISVIADHFDMSPSYFSKRFKKASGENLLDYIHRERLRLAKEIMSERPDATLKEICDLVGYASPLTINRAFRKYEGITPSDYRSLLNR